MGSSLVKIDVHIIFHVKTNSPRIIETDLKRLFQYIGGIIKRLDAIPIAVGGRPDHIHILTTLPKNLTLTDLVCSIKTNSSKWLKGQGPLYSNFGWQDGYGAFSISPSISQKTTDYILHQFEHHHNRTFEEEFKLFLDQYGIEYNERYLFTD
ncbi:MAG: transposase [Bacteroidales bacterium]|nr:transposase [Bacteroidales bacterium]